jgi:hypothetical protein
VVDDIDCISEGYKWSNAKSIFMIIFVLFLFLSFSLSSFFFSCGTGDWTSSFSFAKQVLYHYSLFLLILCHGDLKDLIANSFLAVMPISQGNKCGTGCRYIIWKIFCLVLVLFYFSITSYLFIYFWQKWSFNSGLYTCKAGVLLLEPHLQSIFLWLIWRWGLENYLLSLALNCKPPDLILASS